MMEKRHSVPPGRLQEKAKEGRSDAETNSDVRSHNACGESKRQHAAAKRELTRELAGHKRLQEISCRLIPTDDIETLYEELVAAAIDLTEADRGTMQSFDAAAGELCLLAAQGMPEHVTHAFARVSPTMPTSCAEAMQRGERVIVSDYANEEPFIGTHTARIHLDAGIQAVQSTPLVSRSGQMVGMLSTHWDRPYELDGRTLHLIDILARQAADLIEQRQSEQALRKSKERLRELNRSLEERIERRTAKLQNQTERLRNLTVELASAEQRERRRLAALLHDGLQQLLYGARMQLTLARGKAEDDATVTAALDEASEQIDEALEVGSNLTRQLRPPALYEAGLAPTLKWLASEIAQRHGLAVAIDADEATTGAAEHALSDELKAMLFECARELIFNVVKHAETDRARVALRVDPAVHNADAGSSSRLRLIVEDNGCGFDVETTLRKSVQNGSGFGLFSIRERLAALRGTTSIVSTPGEGTRVELAMPLAAPSDAPAQPLAPTNHHGADRPAIPHCTQVRLVIADDHAVVRQGIANLLADDEQIVISDTVTDGNEAISAVEQHRPDAVLMDVNMPQTNGVEATRRIRRRWPEVVVIGMSVQADDVTERSMLDAGAAAFVPKSGDADRMIETILRVTKDRFQMAV